MAPKVLFFERRQKKRHGSALVTIACHMPGPWNHVRPRSGSVAFCCPTLQGGISRAAEVEAEVFYTLHHCNFCPLLLSYTHSIPPISPPLPCLSPLLPPCLLPSFLSLSLLPPSLPLWPASLPLCRWASWDGAAWWGRCWSSACWQRKISIKNSRPLFLRLRMSAARAPRWARNRRPLWMPSGARERKSQNKSGERK